MTAKRNIEVFSAGCPVCAETVEMVKQVSCEHCAVSVLDMKDPAVADRAKVLARVY